MGKFNLKLSFLSKDTPISLKYRDSSLKQYPHVVKLSGGRSSAYMLAMLLQSGLLSKERGDVVVFNNTSAEHPATYKFVSQLKQFTESVYGIPFFMIEYATYEDISTGHWVRYSTFRLVNDKPLSENNLDGFHDKGEVFEELLSHTAFLPNRHRRVCTSAMKIRVTEQFLASWFACESELEHLGHYGDCSLMTDQGVCETHVRHGGKTPNEVLLRKREFVRNRPVARPEQVFQDFTSVSLEGRQIKSMERASFGGTVDLRSRDHQVRFVSLVGLRSDEPDRLKKLKARICGADGREDSQPSSERVYTPLADNGIEKKDVSEFWSRQSWDLELDTETNLSNCTYCFLKGSKALHAIASELNATPMGNEFTMTPMDVAWWQRIEEVYGRDLVEEKRKKTNDNSSIAFIGFFGENSKFSYKGLNDLIRGGGGGQSEHILDDESAVLACNCTD